MIDSPSQTPPATLTPIEVVIQPQFKRLIFLNTLTLIAFLVLSDAYARYSGLPLHSRGTLIILALSALVLIPGWIDFALARRHGWIANAAGIDIYTAGRFQTSVRWEHLRDVHVRTLEIRISYAQDGKTLDSRIFWTHPHDGRQLQDLWNLHGARPDHRTLRTSPAIAKA